MTNDAANTQPTDQTNSAETPDYGQLAAQALVDGGVNLPRTNAKAAERTTYQESLTGLVAKLLQERDEAQNQATQANAASQQAITAREEIQTELARTEGRADGLAREIERLVEAQRADRTTIQESAEQLAHQRWLTVALRPAIQAAADCCSVTGVSLDKISLRLQSSPNTEMPSRLTGRIGQHDTANFSYNLDTGWLTITGTDGAKMEFPVNPDNSTTQALTSRHLGSIMAALKPEERRSSSTGYMVATSLADLFGDSTADHSGCGHDHSGDRTAGDFLSHIIGDTNRRGDPRFRG